MGEEACPGWGTGELPEVTNVFFLHFGDVLWVQKSVKMYT